MIGTNSSSVAVVVAVIAGPFAIRESRIEHGFDALREPANFLGPCYRIRSRLTFLRRLRHTAAASRRNFLFLDLRRGRKTGSPEGEVHVDEFRRGAGN